GRSHLHHHRQVHRRAGPSAREELTASTLEPDPRGRRWIAPAAIVLAGLFLLGSPVALPCPARALLGVPCPTCGMTRATRLLARGELAAALAKHPLVGVVVPLLAVFVAFELEGYLRSGLWGGSSRI